MSHDPYILITADSHAGASIEQYREYLDPKYRPLFDDWRGSYKNPSRDHVGIKKNKNWDGELRNAEQNGQGVVGEVIYPNTVPPFYRSSLVTSQPPKPEEYEYCLQGIRAHNRWLKDFCDEDPDRRAGVGLILPNDIDEAIKDVEWIAKAGLRGGVLLPLIPEDCTWLRPLYDPCWEPLFAAIQDCDLVMNQHSGQGTPDYGDGTVAKAVWLSEVGYFGKRGYSHLLLSGVFERYPKLKYILTESGCSWAPSVLSLLDKIHYGAKAGSLGEVELAKTDWVLSEPPSYYAQRNCFYGASFPSIEELQGSDNVTVDQICWGNDYPHYEGTYPYNLESLQLTFGEVPERERRMIFAENAARLYKFDLEKLKPLAQKYGPTADMIETPLEQIPEDSGCYLFVNARESQYA
ncbi:amidohydrolase [Pseudomaricurvus alkylphenolicus]|jgi:predicted TIM-barrel fold metal-dependent hydrolase|uniref:amidohydrolase family protein n=1 Tax=Pseudomaricurvus alkylphenolicus TaxID=1306991 RepID=UPI0014249FC2|nr:amidohydrolase family protein [Pseudomaricurvus alkylphenolicus]NIB38943.1 amidohydrolase [Pseudomaricurvus alkylphenolicus]